MNIKVEGKKEAKCPSVTCHICGREFGTTSINIHLKSCEKKWDMEQLSLPKDKRRPCPKRPVAIRPAGSSGTDAGGMSLEQYNESAMQTYLEQTREACNICNRKFASLARLEVHQRSCKPGGYFERHARTADPSTALSAQREAPAARARDRPHSAAPTTSRAKQTAGAEQEKSRGDLDRDAASQRFSRERAATTGSPRTGRGSTRTRASSLSRSASLTSSSSGERLSRSSKEDSASPTGSLPSLKKSNHATSNTNPPSEGPMRSDSKLRSDSTQKSRDRTNRYRSGALHSRGGRGREPGRSTRHERLEQSIGQLSIGSGGSSKNNLHGSNSSIGSGGTGASDSGARSGAGSSESLTVAGGGGVARGVGHQRHAPGTTGYPSGARAGRYCAECGFRHHSSSARYCASCGAKRE